MLKNMRQQFVDLLKDMGFVSSKNPHSRDVNTNSGMPLHYPRQITTSTSSSFQLGDVFSGFSYVILNPMELSDLMSINCTAMLGDLGTQKVE